MFSTRRQALRAAVLARRGMGKPSWARFRVYRETGSDWFAVVQDHAGRVVGYVGAGWG